MHYSWWPVKHRLSKAESWISLHSAPIWPVLSPQDPLYTDDDKIQLGFSDCISRDLLHCRLYIHTHTCTYTYTYTCSMGGTSCQWASVSALMQQCHIQRSTPTYENTFLIQKANWILALSNGKCSSHDCNWLTKWLLPGATDQWENNKINKTHALWLFQIHKPIPSARQTNGTQLSFLSVVWPRCKLKPFKVPTWRSFVIEHWLAKRIWICTQSHAKD